ncbi:MOSC domain-containing protein [Candidatus Uabimicrobium sp. HlEnr_7]|uniref:MOSC domain-containing protein n=1 Tax=Candidatus Uabimicrobium helgolandensis TaxID=3095367 RepID=UPI0035587CB1
MKAIVTVVSCRNSHFVSKNNSPLISLITGLGVEGDAHMGTTVKHRSRVAKDPTQPNLRQVHLIHNELYDELKEKGFEVSPGQMGENITTRNVALLKLPTGTKLYLGESAIVEITGLRNPCNQLNQLQEGLMNAVLDKDKEGNLIRKAGIMGIVIAGGIVKPDDIIKVELPEKPHKPLMPV